MAVDYAIAIPTVVGSLLSTLGAGFILVCYLSLPQKYHFRHAMIINLALSDFVNALNGAVSGLLITASHHDLHHGSYCTFNGFVEQFSVQATDMNILAIAVVTLLTLRKTISIPDNSTIPKVLACLSVWILPAITSFVALRLGLYHPVSGNWCWIQAKPTYLRYILTHGWRFVVIILSICIYIYVYIHLYRHFRQLRMASGAWRKTSQDVMNEPKQDSEMQNFDPSPRDAQSQQDEIPRAFQYNTNNFQRNEAIVNRMLLLNAYPIAYILLWIPGIANRIAEASGNPSRVLAIMQCTTQFVGLANAITYGINERVLQQLRQLFWGPKKPVVRNQGDAAGEARDRLFGRRGINPAMM